MADLSSKPLETLPPTVEIDDHPQPLLDEGGEIRASETVGADLGVEAVDAVESSQPGSVESAADDYLDEETSPAEPVAPVRRAPVPATAPTKDPTLQKIEDILGEDMTDTFLRLPADKQRLFKEKGEETAGLIKQIIEGTKVNMKKIFDLIRKWLKLVPGINQFFLEQEAKIKTDKILKLRP
jgi:hypothetical protein